MTYEQAFYKIKEKFDNADASNTPDFAIQITFTDDDCNGIFYAQVKDGVLSVEPYDYRDNDLAVAISKSALLAYLGGRATLDKTFSSGEAYVESGDASKLADWKNTIKKAAVKKAETKKTEPKKTAAKKAAPAKTEPAKAPVATVGSTAVNKVSQSAAASVTASTDSKAKAVTEVKPTAKSTNTTKTSKKSKRK